MHPRVLRPPNPDPPRGLQRRASTPGQTPPLQKAARKGAGAAPGEEATNIRTLNLCPTDPHPAGLICDTCDKPQHADGICPHYPGMRVDHPDATTRIAGPPSDTTPLHIARGTVTKQSGEHGSCLFRTLRVGLLRHYSKGGSSGQAVPLLEPEPLRHALLDWIAANATLQISDATLAEWIHR
eukprot:scaffold45609_cov36-Phaeocystis_antarctica.AAC.1